VRMSKDQQNQHDLNVERDGEQGEKLHYKLRLVLPDTIVKDDHQSWVSPACTQASSWTYWSGT
jgi:hypothetical protein